MKQGRRILLGLVAALVVVAGSPPLQGQQVTCRNADGVEVLCTTIGRAAALANDYPLCPGRATQVPDIAPLDNLTVYLGCKDDSPCTMRRIGRMVAEDKGIYDRLMLAMLWTESNWNQWDAEGNTVIGGGVDYGAGQLNYHTWVNTYDWIQVEGDILYNVRGAGDILAQAHRYARENCTVCTTDLEYYRAAYAVYNAGPRGWRRPFRSPNCANASTTDQRCDSRDLNFLRNYNLALWLTRLGGCS